MSDPTERRLRLAGADLPDALRLLDGFPGLTVTARPVPSGGLDWEVDLALDGPRADLDGALGALRGAGLADPTEEFGRALRAGLAADPDLHRIDPRDVDYAVVEAAVAAKTAASPPPPDLAWSLSWDGDGRREPEHDQLVSSPAWTGPRPAGTGERGYRPGDPDPTPDDGDCPATRPEGLYCTWPAGHPGDHVAGAYSAGRGVVGAVWGDDGRGAALLGGRLVALEPWPLDPGGAFGDSPHAALARDLLDPVAELAAAALALPAGALLALDAAVSVDLPVAVVAGLSAESAAQAASRHGLAFEAVYGPERADAALLAATAYRFHGAPAGVAALLLEVAERG